MAKFTRAAPHISETETKPVKKTPFVPRYGTEWRLKKAVVTAYHVNKILSNEDKERLLARKVSATLLGTFSDDSKFVPEEGRHEVRWLQMRNTRTNYAMIVDNRRSTTQGEACVLLAAYCHGGKSREVWGTLREGAWVLDWGIPTVSLEILHNAKMTELFAEEKPPVAEPEEGFQEKPIGTLGTMLLNAGVVTASQKTEA